MHIFFTGKFAEDWRVFLITQGPCKIKILVFMAIFTGDYGSKMLYEECSQKTKNKYIKIQLDYIL